MLLIFAENRIKCVKKMLNFQDINSNPKKPKLCKK